jgi:hypothetical protein
MMHTITTTVSTYQLTVLRSHMRSITSLDAEVQQETACGLALSNSARHSTLEACIIGGCSSAQWN